MLVEWQIRRELDSEYTDVIWLGNGARDIRQVVLSACPYQFGLIHVKSESAGGHPLLNSSNTLLNAGYCWLHIFYILYWYIQYWTYRQFKCFNVSSHEMNHLNRGWETWEWHPSDQNEIILVDSWCMWIAVYHTHTYTDQSTTMQTHGGAKIRETKLQK